MKASGLALENIYFYIYDFLSLFFTVDNDLFTSVFQWVYACFYYSIYFFKNYESTYISSTSINDWLLKFSFTLTGNARLFTSLGSARIKLGSSFFLVTFLVNTV